MSENMNTDTPIGTFSAFNTYKTYSWVNNEQFYALVPYPYNEYYRRFIKQFFQWFDGFVPEFHNTSSGMFSTRLAYTVTHKLATQIVGNSLLFNDDGVEDTKTINIDGKEMNSLEFIEYWSKENKLNTKSKQLKEWAMAGGDATLKLDNLDGDLKVSIVRKDNYFMDTDFSGEICRWQGLVYTYSKMVQSSDGQSKEIYYLLEDRQYDEFGVPQYRLSMKKMSGSLLTNQKRDFTPETIPFDRLPRDVSHKFKKDYPNARLGEWETLPLKDLGVYLDKASENVSFLPAMSGGESIFSNSVHIFMLYDYYYSSLANNLYTAKDKLIAPQHMQTPNLTGGDPYFGANAYSGWDSYIMSRIPYTNPEDNKPILWQPSTRAEEWIKVRDNLLQTLAMNISVDERTILSSIVPQSEKPTAREIGSNEHTTTLFVEGQQSYLKSALDKALECVLDFYNFTDECVTVKFNKAQLTNINNTVTVVTLLKQNGLIDDKTALEMVFTDKNDKQIQQILDNLEQAREEELEREQKQMENDVEEKIEQGNNQDTSHIPKPKKKGLFGRNKKE